jgi:hypothetical protein
MTEALTMFYEDPPVDHNRWLRPALMSSDSVEWYTPPHIRAAVLAALGGKVDLDPCADLGKTFPAAHHYTPVENGLAQTWIGRVYMNPPYGREIVAWTTKLRDELAAGWTTEAVALLPARVDTGWWQNLRPPLVCFIRGRLQFSGYEQSAPFPSAAAYFGKDRSRFVEAFERLGQLYAAL